MNKKIFLAIGMIAFAIMFVLNVRYAIDDYGIKNNELSVQLLAKEKTTGGCDDKEIPFTLGSCVYGVIIICIDGSYTNCIEGIIINDDCENEGNIDLEILRCI